MPPAPIATEAATPSPSAVRWERIALVVCHGLPVRYAVNAAEGRDPSTTRNALMPLRVIFRRAVEDGDIAVNPCTHLRLPAVIPNLPRPPRVRLRNQDHQLPRPVAQAHHAHPTTPPVPRKLLLRVNRMIRRQLPELIPLKQLLAQLTERPRERRTPAVGVAHDQTPLLHEPLELLLLAQAAAIGEGTATQDGRATLVFPDLTRRRWATRLSEEFRSGACHAGRYEEALPHHGRALELGIRAGSDLLRLAAVTGQGKTLLLSGRVRRAIAVMEAEVQRRVNLREILNSQTANLFAMLAVGYLQADELDAAATALRDAWAVMGADADRGQRRHELRQRGGPGQEHGAVVEQCQRPGIGPRPERQRLPGVGGSDLLAESLGLESILPRNLRRVIERYRLANAGE